MLLLLWTAAALASPVEAVYADYRATSELIAHPKVFRRIPDEGMTLREGGLDITLTSGWMVPITAGDTDLVGFAWVGDGELTLSLDDRADAMAAATRMLQVPGTDKDDLVPFARKQAPLIASISQGLFLSIDPALTRIFHDPVLADDTPDPLEIVVYADPEGARAARQAAQMFRARHALYQELGLPIADPLAWDRAAREHGVGPHAGTWMLVDLQTDRRFGGVSPHILLNPAGDRWIGWIRDDSPHPRRDRARLFTAGRNDGGLPRQAVMGQEPFAPTDPTDPTSVPSPEARFELRSAHATVQVDPPEGDTLPVEVEARITLEAVGGALQWAELQVPAAQAGRLLEITTADGVPVLPEAAPALQAEGRREADPLSAYEQALVRMVEQTPEDRLSDTGPTPDPSPTPVRVVLPTPLEPGETVELVLRTEAVWPLSRPRACAGQGASPATTTGLQAVLPVLGSEPFQAPLAATLRVGLPLDADLYAVAPGELERTTTEDTRWLTFRPTAPVPWPSVSIASWPEPAGPDDAAAQRAAREVAGAARYAHAIHQELDPISRFLDGWLPPLSPDRPLRAFPEPAFCPPHHGGRRASSEHRPLRAARFERVLGCDLPRRAPTAGALPPSRFPDHLAELRFDLPYPGAGLVAHHVAHQHWGQLAYPASTSDLWIAEALAEVYSCLYLTAAYGPEACAARADATRALWEAPTNVSRAAPTQLADAEHHQPIAWRYAPFVLQQMLRPRIGDEAFFLALDLLLRAHPHEPLTTERLQAAFEDASGQDLTDFFHYWVHQGYVPALSLQWWIDENGQVRGVVRSDVPLGTFEVPVVLGNRKKGEVLWVEVTDGEGRFTAPRPGRISSLHLDPDGRILARQRKVERTFEHLAR